MRLHRAIAVIFAVYFVAFAYGCGGTRFGPAGAKPQTVSPRGSYFQNLRAQIASPLPFDKLTVLTTSGAFTYVNGEVQRRIFGGHQGLAIHVPNGEIIWDSSVVRDIQALDNSGRGHHLDLLNVPMQRLNRGDGPIEHIACLPGQCGGGGNGGACDPFEDQFDGCSTTQYYQPSNDAGCWDGQPCGFTDPGQSTGVGEVLFPDHWGCWLNFGTSPYYFDCWQNFMTQYNWFQLPKNLFRYGSYNSQSGELIFSISCNAPGQSGWMITEYLDSGIGPIGYHTFGIATFGNYPNSWDNPGALSELFAATLPKPSGQKISFSSNWYQNGLHLFAFAQCNYTALPT
ncbi:MAG TPA: hypothetical protein VGZ02_10500 [Candidatus Baltobacteraceae bacterium]|jgi:hypothetical protein|nr:hypothetical protein [Candidatus Baltobacteraceae bacterium]